MKSHWAKRKRWDRLLFWFITVGLLPASVTYTLRADYLSLVSMLLAAVFYYYLMFTTNPPVWVWKANRYLYGCWPVRRLQGKHHTRFWAEFAEEWKERFGEDI